MRIYWATAAGVLSHCVLPQPKICAKFRQPAAAAAIQPAAAAQESLSGVLQPVHPVGNLAGMATVRPYGRRCGNCRPSSAKGNCGGRRQNRGRPGDKAGCLIGKARWEGDRDGAQTFRHRPQKGHDGADDDGYCEHAAFHLVIGEKAERQTHQEHGEGRGDRKGKGCRSLFCGAADGEAGNENRDERPDERRCEFPDGGLSSGDARLDEGDGYASLEFFRHYVEKSDRTCVCRRNSNSDGHEERICLGGVKPVRPNDGREDEGKQRTGCQHREHDGVAHAAERVVCGNRRDISQSGSVHDLTMIPD